MTFVNTVDGFAWLTLYLETVVSSLAWKPSTAATISKLYRRQCEEWVMKTDEKNLWLVDFMCHDFSARGLDPMSQYLIGLGHATSFKGSDTLPVIPAARYFYGVKEDEMPIYSVNASEHSVSTTKIFTVGEQQMIADWLQIFPKGVLSIVSDTFDLWKLITEYLPANKEAIMARDGKLVIRPDSGDPVDIICGEDSSYIKFTDIKKLNDWLLESEDNEGVIFKYNERYYQIGDVEEFIREYGWEGTNLNFEDMLDGRQDLLEDVTKNINTTESKFKGVIELLWDIFGGTVNKQGYKVLDSHIGAIYGDSITPERQVEIYQRLAAKGFAATNIVLGVGSFTYQYNTRDTLGFAAKGAWFEVEEEVLDHHDLNNPNFTKKVKTSYNIYKDPVTDDGTKKSLKGLCTVYQNSSEHKTNPSEIWCGCGQTPEEESKGLLQVIYEDGKFYNQITLDEIRKKLLS